MTITGALLTGAGLMALLALGLYMAFRAGYRHCQRLHAIGGERMVTHYTPPPVMFSRVEEATPTGRLLWPNRVANSD